jgi:uncharacterized protein (TIGR02246 family)
MRFQHVLVLASLSVLTGLSSACSARTVPAATPTPDGSASVQAQMDRYVQAVSQTNADALAALFAPDGQIYDTGQLAADGPAAVRTYLETSYAAIHVESYTTTPEPMIVGGGVAAAIGTFDEKYMTLATGQSGESKGHYTVEWRLQPDGSWLIHRLSTDVVP